MDSSHRVFCNFIDAYDQALRLLQSWPGFASSSCMSTGSVNDSICNIHGQVQLWWVDLKYYGSAHMDHHRLFLVLLLHFQWCHFYHRRLHCEVQPNCKERRIITHGWQSLEWQRHRGLPKTFEVGILRLLLFLVMSHLRRHAGLFLGKRFWSRTQGLETNLAHFPIRHTRQSQQHYRVVYHISSQSKYKWCKNQSSIDLLGIVRLDHAWIHILLFQKFQQYARSEHVLQGLDSNTNDWFDYWTYLDIVQTSCRIVFPRCTH